MKTPLAFASLILALCGLHASAGASTLRTVVLSGTSAPGTSSGVDFIGFGIPVLNDAGLTAFIGQGVGSKGIWSEGAGSGLALVALSGNVAPGTSDGVEFTNLATPVLNDVGQTAFRGFLTGPGVDNENRAGIWSSGGENGLDLIARSGNEAPGTSGGVSFSSSPFSAPVLNNAGQTAFGGRLTGTAGVNDTNDRGIWSEGGGNGLVLVARSGNVAPGTSGGNFLSFGNPVLNDAGQSAFWGFITGTGVNNSNSRGIWSEGVDSGLALVARSGNMAPGTSSGVNFFNFKSPTLNDDGQTAFFGFLAGTGVDDSSDRGIWSEGGGSGLALVARSGNAAPGTSGGANFFNFNWPVLNGAGQTAFVADLTGTGVDDSNDLGIWSEGGGNGLSLIARTGDAAPGTSSGVNFSDFGFVSNLVLNGSGQTAFFGDLTGTGVDSSNDGGIWAEDRSGVLTLIAREGDLIDVDSGPSVDLRAIRNLFFSGITGNEDGRRSSFNDLGQLAFGATFTDGSSGIFVSNLVAVPEPTSWVLAVLGLLGLGTSPRPGKRAIPSAR